MSRYSYNSVQSPQRRVSRVNLFKKKNKRAELTSELITMSFKRKLNLLFPLLFGQHAYNMQINCPSKISFDCITLMKNKKTVKWRIYPKRHTEFINP